MKSRSAFGSTHSSTATTAHRNNSLAFRSAEASEEAASAKLCTSRTAKDLISDVRHAASSLFVQRTRDLTCNEALQERVTALTEEVASLQRLHSDLTAEQAILDAALEEGHQKHKERTEALKGVLTAMEQLSDDQQLCSNVFKTTERVVHSVNGFMYEVLAGGFDSSTTSLSGASHPHTSSSGAAGGRQEGAQPGGGGGDGAPQDDHSDADGSRKASSVLSGRGGAVGKGNPPHPSTAVALAVLLKNSQSFLRGRSAGAFQQMAAHVRSQANHVECELEAMRVTGQPSAKWPFSVSPAVQPSCEGSTMACPPNEDLLRWDEQEEYQPLCRMRTTLEGVHSLLEEELLTFLHEWSSVSLHSSSSEGNPVLRNEEEGGRSHPSLLLWALHPLMDALSSSSFCETIQKENTSVPAAPPSHGTEHERAGNPTHVSPDSSLSSVHAGKEEEEERSRGGGGVCWDKEGPPFFLGYFHALLLPLLEGIPVDVRGGGVARPLFPSLPSTTEEEDGGIPRLLHDMRLFFERMAKADTPKRSEKTDEANGGASWMALPPTRVETEGTLPTASPIIPTVGDAEGTTREEEEAAAARAKGEHSAAAPEEGTDAPAMQDTEGEKWAAHDGMRWNQKEVLSTPQVSPSILSFLQVLARRVEVLRVMGEVVGNHSRGVLGWTIDPLPHGGPFFTAGLQELSQCATHLLHKSATWQAMVVGLTQQREVFAKREAQHKNSLLPLHEKEMASEAEWEKTFQDARSQWREAPALDGKSGEEEEEETPPSRTDPHGSGMVEGSIPSSSSPFSLFLGGGPPSLSSSLWSDLWKEWSKEAQSRQEHYEEWKRVEAALQAETDALSLATQAWDALVAANETEENAIQAEVEKEEALLAHEKALLAQQDASEASLQSQLRTLEALQCAVGNAFLAPEWSVPSPFSAPLPISSMETSSTSVSSAAASAFTMGTSSGDVPPTPASPAAPSATDGETKRRSSSAWSCAAEKGACVSNEQWHCFDAALQSRLPLHLPLPETALQHAGKEETDRWASHFFLLPQPPYPELSPDALERLADCVFETSRQVEMTEPKGFRKKDTQDPTMVASAASHNEKEDVVGGGGAREEKKEEEGCPLSSEGADKAGKAGTRLSFPLPLSSAVVPSSNEEDTSTVLLPSCPTKDAPNASCHAPSPSFLPSALFSSPIGEWLRKEWGSRMLVSSFGEWEGQGHPPPQEEEEEEGQHQGIGVNSHGDWVEKVASLGDGVLPFLSTTELDAFLLQMFDEKENAHMATVIASLIWKMMGTELHYRRSTEQFDQFKVHMQKEIFHLQEQLK